MKSTCCNANVYMRFDSWMCCECEKFTCPADHVIHAPRPLAWSLDGHYFLELVGGRREISFFEYQDLKNMYSKVV